MRFAAGKLNRVIHGRKGVFNGYTIVGDLLEDVNGKRGWLLQIVEGPECGNFSVIDGEIHQSGIVTPLSSNDSTDIVTDQKKAAIKETTEQAITDAILRWEKEEAEKPRT